MMMSECAWAVLKQLKQRGVWDGDLVSKPGRDELMKKGLASRDRQFVGGPYDGCQINALTDTGMKLAALCIEIDENYARQNPS